MTSDSENGTHNKIKELEARDDLSRSEKVERLEQFTAGRTASNNRLKAEANLIAEMRRLVNEHGAPVTAELMREHGQFSPQTYVNHFDSWSEAVDHCGGNDPVD